MSEEKKEGSKLQPRVKAAARSLFNLYEPDLTTEAKARELLAILRALSEPQAQGALKDFFILSGLRYYVVYAGLTAVLLVAVIYAMLYELGPPGGFDTKWVIPQALILVLIIVGLEYLCGAVVWAHRWVLGGKIAVPPAGRSADLTREGGAGGEQASGATLKRCAVELKYLLDTLNDRVGVLNQVMSYLIPAMVAVQVFMLLLPGADDKTSISIVTFGATFLAGFIALFFALPIRLIAHGRVTQYRAWFRKVEAALLDLSDKIT
jgi:hypothetical protein